jgi:hypothetical protein
MPTGERIPYQVTNSGLLGKRAEALEELALFRARDNDRLKQQGICWCHGYVLIDVRRTSGPMSAM